MTDQVADDLYTGLIKSKITDPLHIVEAFISSYRCRGIHPYYYLSLLQQDLGNIYELNTLTVHHSTVMGTQLRLSKRTTEGKPTKGDMDRFVTVCIGQGYTVRHHTHPKTKAKWLRRS